MSIGIDHPAAADTPNAVAIIGMAARFPGAHSVESFWRNLCRGEESIVDLSEEELVAAGIGGSALASHTYIRRAAILDGIDEFDAEFFGFTPQSARMMDPQHRLFLQSAWHAVEDAGYDPTNLEGSVGVFGTSSTSGYLLHNLLSHLDSAVVLGQGATFDMVNLSLQNDKDHLATRVAHQFDLRGPALSVQTACSSSLVAVHLACQSILNGECDMALAGGSSIRVPHRVGYWHEPGSMVSATGHCRPFDVRSDGTIFGSGVGVVVLKSLARAVGDGDRIHAVIRGSAVNNDGATKMNYAAPNATGQAEVIAEAHAVAGVDAATVGYVETHGTGTPLGDPVEVEGLRQAFALSGATRPGPCFIGSVKSNIGHLETAAGIAGLIKAVLCLEHRAIPATLHYTSPNPELRLERGPFVVRANYGAWESDGLRCAGVSSFGVGGTNAHVVLEEAVRADVPGDEHTPAVLLLSARTAEALHESCSALAAELSAAEELSVTSVARTLHRRRAERIRLAAVVDDRQHASAVLRSSDPDHLFIGECPEGARAGGDRVAFLFPGQGTQHVGMAHGLYAAEPEFAAQFDLCAEAFGSELDIDLRAEIFAGDGRSLERTDRAQPALFTVEYALARLAEAYGVTPAAVAGHSIGEYVAATLAGVFDVESAVRAVAMRARLMHTAPRGVMVAVSTGPEEMAQYLTDDVDLAAVNDPGNCVVAGTAESIRVFQARLAEAGIAARRVRTSHGFHSRLMNAVVPQFQSFLSRISLQPPRIPLLSNVTGTWMSDEEATNPATWARQIRSTVRFADELDVLLTAAERVVVEVGPGSTLTSSATRHPGWSAGHRAVRLMRHQAQNRSDHATFLLALGQLWSAGIDVDWSPRMPATPVPLMSLPGYPFVRERHWIDHDPTSSRAPGTGLSTLPAGQRRPDTAGAAAAADSRSQMTATLQSVWAQCLGVASVDEHANFFEIGGDSLVAISVAMAATHQGYDLTPQDLYDNQTVEALAKALTARYETGGLASRSPYQTDTPAVPPNVAHFLDRGMRDSGRWRVPLLLRVRPGVAESDIRTILTALVTHHDALRLRVVTQDGIWEQRFAEPQESCELRTAELPATPDPAAERDAVIATLSAYVSDHDLSRPPLSAVYVPHENPGEPGYLALSVHAVVMDRAALDILLTDLITASAQRLSGADIALAPATTTWREWSQRCAALSTHPAVLDSRAHWTTVATRASLRLATPQTLPPAASSDFSRRSTSLSGTRTAELDAAQRRLGLRVEEILLAALGRTISGTAGTGTVAVDLCGAGRSVLKPDVDLHRTIGWFDALHPVELPCYPQEISTATAYLAAVRAILTEVPHHGLGYGLLRYLYAPTARSLADIRPADVLFGYSGVVPEILPASFDDVPVQLDTDSAMPVRDALPGLGHALELRTYRAAGALHLDWWYDTRRIGAAEVDALADGFPAALLTLVGAALAEDHSDNGADEMALVDLSSTEA